MMGIIQSVSNGSDAAPGEERDGREHDARGTAPKMTIVGHAGYGKETKKIKIQPLPQIAAYCPRNYPGRIGEQQAQSVKIWAPPPVESDSLKEPKQAAGEQQGDKNPFLLDPKHQSSKVYEGCEANSNKKGKTTPPGSENLRDG